MNDILFNVISWYETDEKPDEESENTYKYNSKYIIRMFGRTADGSSVSVKVENFLPHFYVKIPERWSSQQIDKFIYIIKQQLKYYSDCVVGYDLHNKHDLHYGFCNNKEFKFVRLIFNSLVAYKQFSRIFSKPLRLPLIENSLIKLDTYEAKIDPFIRFIHIRHLNSAGWIILPENKYKINYDKVTTDINVKIEWSDVKPYKGPILGLAPLKICSFDIECISVDGSFPQASRETDKIVSICSTFTKYGSDEVYKSHVISLQSCDKIEGAEIECYNTEKDVLIAWKNLIEREDPDIITGYNIFYFDMRYMYERSIQPYINCGNIFSQLSRLKNVNCKFMEKKLSSSGLGDNVMYLYDMIGRSQIDLMKLIQKDYKLTSYKLDKVAENFMKEKIKNIELKEEINNKFIYLIEMNTSKIKKNNYIKIEEENIVDEDKIEIKDIIDNKYIEIHMDNQYFINTNCSDVNICLVKDDMSPQELFDTYDTGSDARKKINQYCIQDCVLVSKLLHKLEFITNNMAMAEISHVSLDYIIMRGQGIKGLSLFAYTCRLRNYLIKDLKPPDITNLGYEGATVLSAKKDFYIVPIVVLDFNSLYPNSERAYNMSPETLVKEPQYYNLENYIYRPIEYSIKDENDIEIGKQKCVFVESTLYGDDKKKSYGILPTILTDLLDARKAAKKLMEKETDPFKKKIYDGKQLAFKLTANSMYGILGAPTSPVFCKDIAASTTALGREMLLLAKDFVEKDLTNILLDLYNAWSNKDEEMVNKILDKELEDRSNTEFIEMMKESILEIYSKYMTYPEVIYGDTDSNFNNFKITDKETNEMPSDINCRKMAINLGLITSKLLKIRLPFPQNMEYEKTFHPFSLMAKKRYIGNKYETNPNKYKRIIMGYTLKRRDNAIIVHKVIGKAVEIAMDEMDINKALNFLKTSLIHILDGKYLISDYITTKTLKAYYKGKNIREENRTIKNLNFKLWDDIIKLLRHNFNENKIKDILNLKLVKQYIDNLETNKNFKINTNNIINNIINSSNWDELIKNLREKYNDKTILIIINILYYGTETKTETIKLDKENINILTDLIKKYINENETLKIPPGINGSWFWDNVNCSIAHVKLCQRIKTRDPGNCPEINDRIPFVTIACDNSKKLLQADRIEHPDYILKNNLKIDYLFYITNQIMNPSIQFFELLTDKLQNIFNDIINKENKINNYIFENKAKEEGFKVLNKYGIYSTKINNQIEWELLEPTNKSSIDTDKILIDYNINNNIIKKTKKTKIKTKSKNKFLELSINDIHSFEI
jgi:DNA polymerase elongation subunit (family B)